MSKYKIIETTAFKLENALYFAELSDIVYESEEKIKNKIGDFGFSPFNLIFINKGDVQLFVVANEEHLLIVYQGSKLNIWDWIRNFSIWRANTIHGKIHAGIEHEFRIIETELIDAINKLQNNNQKVYLTGHSKGAALASRTALEIFHALNKIRIFGVYSYGSPRWASIAVAKKYNKLFTNISYQLQINNDIATRFPKDWFLRFKTVSSRFYFDNDGIYRQKISCLGIIKDSVLGRLSRVGDSVFDHLIRGSYIPAIKKSMLLKNNFTA